MRKCRKLEPSPAARPGIPKRMNYFVKGLELELQERTELYPYGLNNPGLVKGLAESMQLLGGERNRLVKGF